MIRWAQPVDEPYTDKLDDAISRGFDPGEDYNLPPAAHLTLAEGDDWLVALQAAVEEARRWDL